MYPSQARSWLTLAGISVACCLSSCSQPEPKNRLGNLPEGMNGDVEPKVNATTYFAHGHLLERQGQFERAVVRYRKAVTLRPNFLSALNRLGITLNKLGRNAEASGQFRRAIRCRPELAYLHNNLGFSLYLDNKYEEAETAFRQALSLKPDFPRAHMNRALALSRMGRLDDAFSDLLEVGSEADACFNMGIILTEAEQYADAASYLEAALAVKPDFDVARQQLREVSRLAAEMAARQEAELALAAETAIEDIPPQPAEAAIAGDTVEDAMSEAGETAVVGGAMPEAGEATIAEAEAEAPESMEPAAVDAGTEGEAAESTDMVATDFDDTDEVIETAEAVVADTESTASEPAETIEADNDVDDVDAEFVGPIPMDTSMDAVATEEISFATDDLVLASDSETVITPLSIVDNESSEAVQFEQESAIDAHLLVALINEALDALPNNTDVWEELWCEISSYFSPETAPDELAPALD